MRAHVGSFLISAAIVATACGTQSPASPSAAILHGDSHQGGGDHGGNGGSNSGSNGSNSGSNNGSTNGSNSGSNHGGNDDGATHENEFSGLVTAVGGNSITVGGQKITVDPNTRITSKGNTVMLADIKVGDRVEVQATVSGATVTATRIQIEDAEDKEPGDDNPANPNADVEVKGPIAAIGAGCPAVTMMVGTTTITTSAATTFEDTTCAALAVGVLVEVNGTRQSNGSVAATRIERQ